jgi:hypothetical protein
MSIGGQDSLWSESLTKVPIKLDREGSSDGGVKSEEAEQLPSKAPFCKRFEVAVCLLAELGTSRVAVQFRLAAAACGPKASVIWNGGLRMRRAPAEQSVRA